MSRMSRYIRIQAPAVQIRDYFDSMTHFVLIAISLFDISIEYLVSSGGLTPCILHNTSWSLELVAVLD